MEVSKSRALAIGFLPARHPTTPGASPRHPAPGAARRPPVTGRPIVLGNTRIPKLQVEVRNKSLRTLGAWRLDGNGLHVLCMTPPKGTLETGQQNVWPLFQRVGKQQLDS